MTLRARAIPPAAKSLLFFPWSHFLHASRVHLARKCSSAVAGAVAAGIWAGTGAAAAQGGGTPGRFDFYVLALSWSPAFCEETVDRRGSRQCDAGQRLGFVVHGLWPQYERGFPSNCGIDRTLPRSALDEAVGVFPDEGLARYEWRRHGTCSGLGPVEYMKAVREARDKVRVPEALLELSKEGRTTPQAIERAFSEANTGLRADMMAVQCKNGAFQEIRVCFSRDLRDFRTCPEVDRRACRFGPIRVPAPR